MGWTCAFVQCQYLVTDSTYCHFFHFLLGSPAPPPSNIRLHLSQTSFVLCECPLLVYERPFSCTLEGRAHSTMRETSLLSKCSLFDVKFQGLQLPYPVWSSCGKPCLAFNLAGHLPRGALSRRSQPWLLGAALLPQEFRGQAQASQNEMVLFINYIS